MLPIVRNATTNTLVGLSLENTTTVMTNIIPPKNSNFALTVKRVAKAAGIWMPVRDALSIPIGHSIAEVISATS